LDDFGNPTSVGITLTETALEDLPDHDEDAHSAASYTLTLPKEKSKTTFDHIELDWNAHGHEPEHIYDKAHFDFHFYMITEPERKLIGVDDPKSEEFPEGKYLPATYVPVPGSVPQMGKHWVDPYSGEFQEGGTFTHTFIYGSYDKQITFYEPMITKDFLLTKPTVSFPILQPEAFQKAGYYAGKYSVKYDSVKKEYQISLDDLSKKSN
jgi:hypothetical protein